MKQDRLSTLVFEGLKLKKKIDLFLKSIKGDEEELDVLKEAVLVELQQKGLKVLELPEGKAEWISKSDAVKYDMKRLMKDYKISDEDLENYKLVGSPSNYVKFTPVKEGKNVVINSK